MMNKACAFLVFSAAGAAFGAKIEISQNHADALYRVGEEAVFTIAVKGDDGAPLKDGTASWKLDNFGSVNLDSGQVDLADGNPFTVRGKMDEEGFLRLNVTSASNSVVWGVGYDVEKIRQREPCPADFDAYWKAEKARLDREVPLDPKMTLDESLSKPGFDCYRVSFATFGGKRVYGFLAVPKDKKTAPFRVRVSVPGSGPGFVSGNTVPGEISLMMNVHTFEPEKTEAAQNERMNRQNVALAERFGLPEKNAYCDIAGIAESREEYWYHDVMLGINRAVDWVCSRPDVDLTQVTYTGSSQGGGFGLFLSYLNTHFTKTFVAVCAMTGHYGFRQKRQAGSPLLISRQPAAKRAIAERNAAYFDGVNFAARIRTPIRFIVAFADMACAPANVYAAYNACPSVDKDIVNAVGSGHNWFGWHAKRVKEGRCYDFNEWLRTKENAVAPDGRVTVRAFGAVGDGVHDDTVALQKALDKVDGFRYKDVRSWGEGPAGCAAPEIVLPAGTYRITRPLVAVRTFTLRGEKGAVIDAAGVKGPALYIDLAYRCTIDGMTFRNGESHVAFWTRNDDTASVLIKDCLFENAEKEAVWTESWRTEPVKDSAGKVVQKSKAASPFEVTRDDAGLPVLKPLTWELRLNNSTRFTMHDCKFIDCGAAYRGATDAQYITRVWFRSSRPQKLPPFKAHTEVQMTDVRILANIPEGFSSGYLEGLRGNFVLSRVSARSSSPFGAPLMVNDARPRRHRPDGRTQGMAWHMDVYNCEADSANSPSGAFLHFRNREPALLHVRGCTESNGKTARLVRIDNVPTDLESMRDVGGECEDNVPMELTHRWLFEDNDASLDPQVPAILAQCLEKPLPYAAFAGFPEAEAKITSPRSASNTVFRACDYGIGIDRGRVVDETKALERLFAAAAKAENPLVELPGRTIGLSRAITLPRRISIQGAGRAILRGLNPSNDIFRVESGDAPLAIDFDNMGFVNGRFAVVAAGAGRVHFQNGILAINRGFAFSERGGTLDTTVIDSTVYSQQLAYIDGATFRMRDSWVEFLAARHPHVFIDNKRGTVMLERIAGVPITATYPSNIGRPKNLPDGVDLFWIRNEDGVVRSREFRYGGEFGGIASFDNYGAGRILVETGFTLALNGGTIPCIFRNNSPEGRITISHAMLLGIGWEPPHVGHGVRPKEEWRSGLRLNRDQYEDSKQKTK